MGPRPVRITRDELLTPPEFRGRLPTDHEAGRVGGARIELVQSGNETRLGTCYQQIPMRLLPPFSFDGEAAALLYLINLTAGLMDGDGHLIQVTARAGTHAIVTGQSATRIHPALNSFATQQWRVDVEDDACLVVLPGPAIPFRGCRYFQYGRVRLAPRARLLWGDIWFPGRYNRGALSERFEFETIVQDFEVRQDARLVFRDRFRWDGPWTRDQADWFLGGELVCASLFIAGELPSDLVDGVSTAMPGEAGQPPASGFPTSKFRRAVFRLDAGVSCLRWCGEPAAVTEDLVHQALRIAGSWTSGPGGPPWIVASGNLAPNHWFSRWADGRGEIRT